MSDLWLVSVPGESYTGFNNVSEDLAKRECVRVPLLTSNT